MSLSFAKCGIRQSGFTAIVKKLPVLTELRSLKLVFVFPDAWTETNGELGRAVKQLGKLRSLQINLKTSQSEANQSSQLVSGLIESVQHLQTLIIKVTDSRISSGNLKGILDSISKRKRISQLVLKMPQIGIPDSELAEALKCLGSLANLKDFSISLERCQLKLASTIAISEVIQKMESLRVLRANISYNSIGDIGFNRLTRVFDGLDNLEELSLDASKCDLRKLAVMEIPKKAEKLKTLSFKLNMNQIEADALGTFVEKLEERKPLLEAFGLSLEG